MLRKPQRFPRMRKRIAASGTAIVVGILALALFAAPLVAFITLQTLAPPPKKDSNGNVPSSENVPWYQDEESKPFITLTRIAVFSAAALFGALGATMSIMTRQSIGESITRVRLITPSRILTAQVVGAVFSTILAFFFAGGLIEGALFPSHEGDWFLVAYLHKEFFKLLVWSFLGGFSERLAPQLFLAFSTRIQQEVQRETLPKGAGTDAKTNGPL